MSLINSSSIFFIWISINVLFWNKFLFIFGLKFPYIYALNLLVFILIFLVQDNKIKLNHIFITLFFLAYSFITFLYCDFSDFKRSIATFSLLAPNFIICFYFSKSKFLSNYDLISKISLFIKITVIFAIFLQYLGLISTDRDLYHGFFNEPSHLAYCCIIFILFPFLGITENNFVNKVSKFLSIILVVLSPSLTLLTLLASFFLLLNIKRFTPYRLMIIFFIIFFTIFIVINNDYLLFRFTGLINPEHPNLSSLLYFFGWKQIGSDLYNTIGLGLGFNAKGCLGYSNININDFYTIHTAHNEYLADVIHDNQLNYQDGSFLASKIISEFGIFGIIFYFFIIFKLFKLYKIFNISNDNVFKLIYISSFLFVVISFTRTGSYVSIFFILPFIIKFLSWKNNFKSHVNN